MLVFRAKENIDSKFLYYVLSNNAFFDFAVATSKGTKMPRGDKTAIMQYEVPHYNYDKQKAIAATLSCLDDKIELNNRINANLEAQAQAIFKSWFVDFEPFQDGEFVDSELGPIPKGWRVGTLGEIITIFDYLRVPLSSRQRSVMKKIYPYYGAAALMDYVDSYIFDGIYLLIGEDGTVVDSNGHPILQYVWGKFWVNNHAHIVQGINGFSVEHLYVLLKKSIITHLVTGAVQAKISQTNLKKLRIVIAPKNVLEQFDMIIQPLFRLIRKKHGENCTLSTIRDTLLPKLMSGEIEVPVDK